MNLTPLDSDLIPSADLEPDRSAPVLLARLRFGDVSAALGYVTREQVAAALAVQRLDREAGRPHRLLGQILVDLGALTERDVSEILDSLLRHGQPPPPASGRRKEWRVEAAPSAVAT